ncbi:diguanylate cyclase domain-containing protein [Marinobacterium halophilum]
MHINIDHFRGINDRYGQEAGDQTLFVIWDTISS